MFPPLPRPVRLFAAACAASLPGLTFAQQPAAEPVERFDVVVYGGNAAGVMAAVQVRRMGRTVVLVEPGPKVGGLTTSGLGATDIGRPHAIGGLARRFYRMVYLHYKDPAAWKYETRDGYLPKHEDAIYEELGLQFFFEPTVAEQLLLGLLAEHQVPVGLNERLDRSPGGVRKEGSRITAIRLESGVWLEAGMFIDTTYEGDLMAAAGVSYVVGREANAEFGETLNGIRAYPPARTAHIDPWLVPGDPTSGPLPGVLPAAPGPDGAADHRVQAYNYRVPLTDVPENRIPFSKPEGYDPMRHELLARHLQGQPRQTIGRSLFKLTPMPNRKTDSNNQGMFSTDYVGRSYTWAEATYAERAELAREHKAYVQGHFWFLVSDPRVPEPIRRAVAQWGWPRDEFVEHGNFPWQVYVREARRMRGYYVITEHDCRGERVAEDSIGLAAYAMDSHQVSRFVDEEGRLRLEGPFWQTVPPYPVSLRAITPRNAEATNLLVPVCVSATHAAFGSLRMEPVFMILAQSAATAAVLALEHGVPVQDVPYPALRERLEADGQLLTTAAAQAMRKPRAAPVAATPQLGAALAALRERGLIGDEPDWTTNTRTGRTLDGALLAGAVLRAARIIQPRPEVTNVREALAVLVAARVIDNDAYWRERLPNGRDGRGDYAGALLQRLANAPAIRQAPVLGPGDSRPQLAPFVPEFLATLLAHGVIDETASWQRDARRGRRIESAALTEVVLRSARALAGEPGLTDPMVALERLQAAGIIEDDTYWRVRIEGGRPSQGEFVASLLEKVAAHPALATAARP